MVEHQDVERNVTFGSKKPVMIKVSGPVFICPDCGCEVHDWRMERAKSLALSAWMKENHVSGLNPPEDLRIGHAACSHHKKQLEYSGACGCFYCLSVFTVGDIEDWIDNGETARCPKCGIDSVIPLTEVPSTDAFLKRMQEYWFDAGKAV